MRSEGEMKKVLSLLAAVFFALPLCAQYNSYYSELDDSDLSSVLKEHVSFVASSSLEGRRAGSEGEKAAAEYVEKTLRDYGVEMLSPKDGDIFGIGRPQGDTVTSRNIVGVIQGYDPALRDRYLVVGARLDNLGTNVLTVDGETAEQIYYGANGNASGLALMMELARMVSTNNILFRRSVIFVAFGSSREGFAGSWYFLNRSFKEKDKIDAMINLDMLGVGNKMYAYTASNPDMNSLLSSLEGEILPLVPELTSSEPYPSDHRSFYAASIPSVFFTTGVYAEHDSPRDTPSILQYDLMERELEYLYVCSRTLANVDVAPSFRGTGYGDKATDEKAYSYYDCDVKPSFMGHADPAWFMTKWVYQYLRYPQEAVDNGIQGRVNVRFTIEKDGKVSEVTVTKGIDELLDAEALRVVKASPKWKAAKVDGKTVRSYITIPIDFILEKKGGKARIGIKK